MHSARWALVALGCFGAVAACGDDFTPCDDCGKTDAGNDGSAASGGAAGSSGQGGSAGSGGSAGVGASGGSAGTAGAAGSSGSAGADAAIPCKRNEDCPDPATMICDPSTAQCGPPQCSDTKQCDASESCGLQNQSPQIGACYQKCEAGGIPCPGGAMCMAGGGAGVGICVKPGTGPAHGDCDLESEISTKCVAGFACTQEGPTPFCREICDYWSGTMPCPSGECSFWATCNQVGDIAVLGDPCSQPESTPCAADGTRWTGICLTAGSDVLCLQPCRLSESGECLGGKTCTEVWPGEPVGVCD